MRLLESLKSELGAPPSGTARGIVTAVRGPIVLARIPVAALGDLCSLRLRDGRSIAGQVIAFENDFVSVAPFEPLEGLAPGAEVTSMSASPSLAVSNEMLGTIVDSLGKQLGRLGRREENRPPETVLQGKRMSLFAPPPPPLERRRITEQLETGVTGIDAMLPIGYGQRVGLFAGAGVGKSTLLGMIARNARVDVTVIALVGERGREVNDFIHDSLGPNGAERTVMVIETSDACAMKRFLAPFTATAIAEYFRERGNNVLLLVDSLTRMARARRDVGLSAGELPVRQGYTASVYTDLPRLLERAGTSARGSITGVYTVLTHGEGESDALGDEVKSILDGHLVLSSRIGVRGVRPALDQLQSVSRVADALIDDGQRADTALLRRALFRLDRDRDIALLGGTPDAELEAALEYEERIVRLLAQEPGDVRGRSESRALMAELCDALRARRSSEA